MRLSVVLVLILLAGCAARPPAPPPVAAKQTPAAGIPTPEESVAPLPASRESLADFVRRAAFRQSYGMYAAGKKIGWARMTFGPGRYKGRDVAETFNEFHMRVSMMGETARTDLTERTFYELAGEGPVVAAREVDNEDGTSAERDVHRSSTGFLITTRTAGKVTRRVVPARADTLRQEQQFERWLASAKSGDRTRLVEVSWDEDPVASIDEYTFLGGESMRWGGVETRALRVRVDSKGVLAEALLSPNGIPWRAEAGGFIQIRAEDEVSASRLEEPVDLLSLTRIPLSRPIPDAETVDRIVLEVKGANGFAFPTSHRQTVSHKEGRVMLAARREFRVPQSDLLSPTQRRHALRRTPTVDIDETIVGLARRITRGARSLDERVGRLVHWVYKALDKRTNRNASTARAVLSNRAGDCTEHTLLFVALARATGIPAREVGGLAYVDGAFGWHAWAQIHDGHQWVSVDPTWVQVRVDATHIQMQRDESDLRWMNVAAGLRFTLIEP
ncbi:MAG: transglutaminase domain-containing protein [Armatimonadetes bacterium]|nr:transglutaminase domain-containing protein [Armatimonadota bacterium]